MREWLIQLRKSKRMTQQQVASRCFIERSYYSQIEREKRNPSTIVAKNIANVLEFNPLKFFNSELDLSLEGCNEHFVNHSFHYDIESYFDNNEKGKIIYLYNNIQHYNRNLLTYLLAGVKKKRHCFVIDNLINYHFLYHLLESTFTEEEILTYFHFMTINSFSQSSIDDILFFILQDQQSQLNESENIYVWIHKEKVGKSNALEKELKNYYTYNNILLIQAYHASLVSAGDFVKLMKKYPHVMTDEEIVNSPFYWANNNSLTLPSLYVQEDT